MYTPMPRDVVGDAVVVRAARALNCHRIVEISEQKVPMHRMPARGVEAVRAPRWC